MTRSIFLVSVFVIVSAGVLFAQDRQPSSDKDKVIPELRRRALVLDINARVLESENVVTWNETHQKITMPGNPVSIRLEGANLVVAVQFTPFIRRSGNVLFSQVQIGIKDSDQGFSYYTSIQTIPFEFNEPILFFPLGETESSSSSSIEIILKVNPYREASDKTNNEN